MKAFNRFHSLRAGFTLVEIMIVIAIIGLLSAMAIPAYQKIRRSAVGKTMDNDARQLSQAAQQYFTEYGITTVSVTSYNSDTGAIGGALSPYVARIAKGYVAATITASALTTEDGPVMEHPLLPAAVSYAPEGQRTSN